MTARPSSQATVTFIKDPGPRYRAHLQRPDGVVVELVAGGYNEVGGPAERVPHDMAHLIVEDELAIACGLWGTLAAGGLFDSRNTRVIAGRQPPHAGRRARDVVKRAEEDLRRAEIVVRAVADLARAGRPRDVAGLKRATGERWAIEGVDPERLAACCRRLREAAEQWAELAESGTIELSWRHLPPSRRGRRGG